MYRQRGKESNTPLFEESEEIILKKYFRLFFPDVPDSYLLLRKELCCTWMNPNPKAPETIINSSLMSSFCPFTFKLLCLLVLSCHLFVSKPATKRLETKGMQKVTFGNEEPLQNECLLFSSDKASTLQCVYKLCLPLSSTEFDRCGEDHSLGSGTLQQQIPHA